MNLVIELDGKRVATHPLDGISFFVGRSPDNQVVLDNPEVSRKHGRIFYESENWFYEDLGSKRGTFKQGKQIQKFSLTVGEEFAISPFILKLTSENAPIPGRDPNNGESTDHDVRVDSLIQSFMNVQEKLEAVLGREDSSSLFKNLANLEQRFTQLNAFSNIAKMANQDIEVKQVLNISMDCAIKSTGAERGFILLKHRKKEELECVCGRKMGDFSKSAIPLISRTITDEVFNTGKPKLVNDAFINAPDTSQSLINYKIKSVVAVPLRIKENVFGVIYLDNRQQANCFQPAVLEFLHGFSDLVSIAIRNAQLYEDSITDSLTGMFNKRYLMQKLKEEYDRAYRYRKSFSLLMIDIDHFKKVNDKYGHQVGDEVLRLIALEAEKLKRETDFLARFGGEEFTALLTETGPEGAYIFAERLRKMVEIIPFNHEGKTFQVTLSIGIETFQAHFNSHEELLANADRELYRAKNSGRNKVCIAIPARQDA